jgi:hypothetical protein
MTGRPSDFTDEIATRICDLLMDGLSMRSVPPRITRRF